LDNLEGGIAAVRTWSRVARGMIALFLLVLLVLFAGNSMLLVAELSGGGGSLMVWEPATGVRQVSAYNRLFALLLGGSVALLGAFFLLAALPIAVWIFRAHANLHEAGLTDLSYSPRWTVVSYFVPLVNLVIPFRAMRELHNRSHGEDVWQARAAVAHVSSWWSCHIAALGVLAGASFVAALAAIPNLYVVQPSGVNTGLFLFALVLLAGSAIFLFRTIGAVTSAQQRRIHLNTAQVFA
jgi:hypothetical protein